MRVLTSFVLVMATHSALAGVGYEEADYIDMADVIVDATVTESACVNAAETSATTQTDYDATLTVSTVVKGEGVPTTLSILSRVTEYKGEQPDCSDNGRVHPEGETARYYLVTTDDPMVYRDIDSFSTFAAEDSSPSDAPQCGLPLLPVDDQPLGCSVTQAVPGLALWLPLFALFTRRK